MKKPSIKQVQADLAKAQETITRLQEELQNRVAEVNGLKTSQSDHDRTMVEIAAKLRVAQKALAPFHRKTTKWEWPSDDIAAIMPLTFGDIRAASVAAVAVGLQ